MNIGRSVASRIRPHLKWINQVRYMKPSVQIAQDKFVLTMDVKNFFKDEITVTAKQDCVVIEGRQERKCKNGLVVRQFVRKFRLPEGCTPSRMETRLSDTGVLTFIAHRFASDIPRPCDRKLPISGGEENNCASGLQNTCCVPPNSCCMPQEPSCEDSCGVQIKVSDDKDSCASLSKKPDNQPEK